MRSFSLLYSTPRQGCIVVPASIPAVFPPPLLSPFLLLFFQAVSSFPPTSLSLFHLLDGLSAASAPITHSPTPIPAPPGPTLGVPPLPTQLLDYRLQPEGGSPRPEPMTACLLQGSLGAETGAHGRVVPRCVRLLCWPPRQRRTPHLLPPRC